MLFHAEVDTHKYRVSVAEHNVWEVKNASHMQLSNWRRLCEDPDMPIEEFKPYLLSLMELNLSNATQAGGVSHTLVQVDREYYRKYIQNGSLDWDYSYAEGLAVFASVHWWAYPVAALFWFCLGFLFVIVVYRLVWVLLKTVVWIYRGFVPGK